MTIDQVTPLRDGALADWRASATAFEAAVATAVVGQAGVVRALTIALFSGGHVLLEGDVGVGKTTLLRAVARALGGAYERVEGTVDLMPGDLVYHSFIDADGRPMVEPGPLLTKGEDLAVFFFNEINRARPQVHALMLRVMAERSLTAFRREWHFPDLTVFADRNRLEREETFELPAAARDRFMMELTVEAPSDTETRRRLLFDPAFHDTDRLIETVPQAVFDHRDVKRVGAAIQRSVRASEAIERYALALWDAARDPGSAGIAIDGVDMGRLLAGGASPRGMSFLIRAARVRAWLEGRDILLPEDFRAVFRPVIAHRLFLAPVYETRRDRIVPEICRQLFEKVPAP
jgi:MoxR-like ATPase